MCASLHYFVFISSPKGITITHVSPFEKKNSSSLFQYKRKRHATRTQTSWNQFKIPVVKNWPIKKNLKRNNCDGIPSNSLPQCWVLWKANNRCLTSWKEQVEHTAIFGLKKKLNGFGRTWSHGQLSVHSSVRQRKKTLQVFFDIMLPTCPLVIIHRLGER